MNSKSKNILILNGSLGAEKGNTSILIQQALMTLHRYQATVEVIHLKKYPLVNLKEKLNWADGFIFTSGTYWDSWGSPLQKFLEDCTEFEATNVFFNKPASVLISMHSVGGKEVLSRLQGVLSTMGLSIPPMSGLVYSLAAHLAIHESQTSFKDDFWSLEDIEVTTHNLITAILGNYNFKSWPVDTKDPTRRWL